MKKLLITGASGFVGQNICQTLKAKYQITGTYFNNEIVIEGVDKKKVDLTDRMALMRILNTVRPDIIINASAVSNPNDCENDPIYSYKMNVSLNEYLAEYSFQEHVSYVSFSTDLIFNGENAPYKVSDDEKPINEYGMQKKLSEIINMKENPKSIIVRVPPMFGKSYGNSTCFTDPMIQNLRDNQKINLFEDEYRSFVHVSDVIAGIETILDSGETGIFHLAGKQAYSRFEFGEELCKIFKLDSSLLNKTKQSDIKMSAQRPKNTEMYTHRLVDLGFKQLSLTESLKKYKKEL